MNLTDILPELLRSAKELITNTAGIRQFEETRSDLHAGYLLNGQVVAVIATELRALETAVITVEQALAEMDAERRRLEAAFAALTSDDQEESPRRPTAHRVAEKTPVPAPVLEAAPPVLPVVALEVPPVPGASRPASGEAPPAPPTVPPVPGESAAPKKSGKKVKRCKKCHKRKKCTCDHKA